MQLDSRFAPVLQEMEHQVRSGLRPSIQGCVRWKGEVVFDAATGGEANTDSPYLMWSSTKPLVAIALLQLVEEGRLALEDRVDRLIPEFAQGGKDRATVLHLLTHRGGFPDVKADVSKRLTELASSWEDCIRFVCEMEALWEPGKDRGYHPRSSWYILGELVQRLRDQPLTEVVRERVLAPCAIAQDAFSLGDPERLACKPLEVHTNGERGAPPAGEARYWNEPSSHAALIPGASGIGRCNELTKLYQTLLDAGQGPDGRLLSPAMIRTATFPHAVGTLDRTFVRDIPWGLGFHLKHAQPSLDDCGTLATPGSFGHAGHFIVNTFWADPHKQLAVGFLSNGLAPARESLEAVTRLSDSVHRIVDALVDETG